MKNHCKRISVLLALCMAVMLCVGSMSVWAEADDDVKTTAADDIDENDITAMIVSGCDLNANDLTKVKVSQYGFSMLVPKGTVITLESDAETFAASNYSRPYFMEQGCILYALTEKQNYCAITVFVSDRTSIYDYYGDYNRLSEAKQKELVDAAAAEGNNAEFVTINGRRYLQVTSNDASTGDSYTQYQFTTVIDHKEYVIYISTLNANDNDKAVLNKVIGSIKLRGQMLQMTSADIVLTVICLILLISVCVIYFFFYRANQFVKAGIVDYPRLGFDLPKALTSDEAALLEGEEDDDEDDEDDEDEEESADEEDVEDEDDERIIKQ